MARLSRGLLGLYCALVPLMAAAWILSIPNWFGLALVDQQVLSPILGIAVAACFLRYPYRRQAGLLEIVLGLCAIAAWCWAAVNYQGWVLGLANRTPDKWVPGIVAIVLMLEGLRKSCGLPIAALAWAILAYGMFGYHLPGVFQAVYHPVTQVILYNYADANGIPGLVLNIICGVVVAFVVLGQVMEVSGATKFFTDLAMGWMGHRRGGPAKVAVVASSVFGMVSSSVVASIMSIGIVTIPLMKRGGFRARYAAAIEAASSSGAQIAPPVMGATAFLIANFLDISYAAVVLAAALPAILYYVALFVQVDTIAVKEGLGGLPRSETPDVWKTFLAGWVFVLPLCVLLYFMFWLDYRPSLSAYYAVGAFLVLLVIKNLWRERRLVSLSELRAFVLGSGENALPIIMIGAAAGAIIGVMNSSGLGFQLAMVLTSFGHTAGLLPMLAGTAVLAIILGMGMPTAAIYIILSIVLGPAFQKLGLVPIAAHLFLFYFGLLSFLTPPVAIASYVAAGVAGSNMWETGMVGMRLAIVAYLLPFLWIYNPALVFHGSWLAIAYVFVTAGAGVWLLGKAMHGGGIAGQSHPLLVVALAAGGLAIGGATLWLGPENPLNLLAAAAGVAAIVYLRRWTEASVAGRPPQRGATAPQEEAATRNSGVEAMNRHVEATGGHGGK